MILSLLGGLCICTDMHDPNSVLIDNGMFSGLLKRRMDGFD
jgi:hypothetical protein